MIKERLMIKKLINASKTYLYQQPLYHKYYHQLPILPNVILIESTHGRHISGHLFYLLKELEGNYPQFKLYVAGQQVKEIKSFLSKQNFQQVQVVKHLSRRYLQLLASAEYLLNDTSFYSFFIKKSGQKYFNFWHGTPLKALGKDVEQVTAGANVQRNFYMTDAIIVSNTRTKEVLADTHGLNGIYQGQMLIAPSPRNSILLDPEKRDTVRQQLKISHQKIVFYMPTWRGTVNQINNTAPKVLEDLRILSKGLTGGEQLYVKLHPFEGEIDLSEFKHIHPMPADYELYEFLTAVDVLITDYSSIIYDFLLVNRPIILYTYDQEEYLSSRRFYDEINRYPFTQVKTVKQLLQVIQAPIKQVDYGTLKAEFCQNDHLNGAAIVCDYLFKNSPHPKVQTYSLRNEKENALILGGGFWDNGVTTALLNTFENIDLNSRNYVVVLGQHRLKKEHAFRVRNLPREIIFYPIPETILAGIMDRFLYLGYMRFEWFNNRLIEQRIGRLMKTDFARLMGAIEVNHFVHYTGFGNRYGELMKHLPDSINKVMFVHTDMLKEYEAKKNFSKRIIFSAYEHVDKVAVVHRNLKADLIKVLPTVKDKLFVVNNFLGEQRIRQLATEDLVSTLMPTTVEYGIELSDLEPLKDLGPVKSRLLADLRDPFKTCFINIGRYDYQKGHERLIEAFEGVYLADSSTRLIIVAPHGPMRNQTLAFIEKSSARLGIYVLGRMSNPYPLLKASDVFVLSSHYEGLGLVVYEALAVNTAVITVNLTETVQYLQQGEAQIVDNSMEGLRSGMLDYLTGGDTGQFFDFSVPRQQSLAEFETLFKQRV